MSARAKTFMLIDGHSLLYRAFFALPESLTRADGSPTNAVYGMALMLRRLLSDERPDGAVIAFDGPGRTFRTEVYDEYKANRSTMPDALVSQIDAARQLAQCLGLKVIVSVGCEADDVIGTMSLWAKLAGYRILIVTGDRDALQLVDDQTEALITRRGIVELERYDAAYVAKTMGVTPAQIVDYKALVGDASDNIPGVKGIGPKTAVSLLGRYGRLQAVLEHAAEVGGRTGKLLAEHRQTAELSYDLARIRRDIELGVELDECLYRGPDRNALAAFYREYEFRGLLEELTVEPAEAGATPAPAVALVLSPYEESAFARWLERATAPPALLAYGDEVANRPAHLRAVVLADRQRGFLWRGEDALPEPLARVLADPALPKVTHDSKRVYGLARAAGVAASGLVDDVHLAAYLVDATQGSYALDALALRYLKRQLVLPPADAAGDNVAPDAYAPAAAALFELQDALHEQLSTRGLMDLYTTVELPLARVLAEMEWAGVALDAPALARMSVELGGRIEHVEERIWALAGERFNLNSPKQLARILFEKLGLPVLQKTKQGPSTAADVLEALAEQHEIAHELTTYRQLTKLKGTYLDTLPSLVHPVTGRIHTHFEQAVAATGRLSSQSPNLQNIPVRSDEGRRIRRAFVPKAPGWRLISADYSQIELRVLAHLSRDENLSAAFRAGLDIHTKTAAEILGIAPEAVTPAQRSGAKAINFGIVYGISSFGLAKGTGLSRDEAGAYIDGYFERYPGVKRYMEASVAQARADGYVTTLLGRRRYLPDIHSRRYAVRQFAERTAINTPVQGSAADLIKLAMIKIAQAMVERGDRARMLLQVHDELVFETPATEVGEMAALIKSCMESVACLSVPLVAEVAAGENWLDLTPIEARHA